MALLFGNGATYDSLESRFRTYRKEAEKLKKEASENGIKLKGGTGGRGDRTPRTPRSGRGGVSKSGEKKGPSSAAKSIKAHFEGTPTKSKKSVFGPGTSQNDAIALDDDDEEDNVQVKKLLKEEVEELLYGGDSTKPKVENTGRKSLYDISPERVQEKVDSQSNGYVAPERRKTNTKPTFFTQKTEDDGEAEIEEDHSEYEDAYEYEDMA